MKNSLEEDIRVILECVIALLRRGEADGWASALEKTQRYLEVDPKLGCSKILAMYGGMGSLNDVVLYKDGRLLIFENSEFDRLSSRLYECCKAMV